MKLYLQNREIKQILIGLAIVFIFLAPIHEYGHYFVARLDGVYVYEPIHWFWIDKYGFHDPIIAVNEFTFSSANLLVFSYNTLSWYLRLTQPKIMENDSLLNDSSSTRQPQVLIKNEAKEKR